MELFNKNNNNSGDPSTPSKFSPSRVVSSDFGFSTYALTQADINTYDRIIFNVLGNFDFNIPNGLAGTIKILVYKGNLTFTYGNNYQVIATGGDRLVSGEDSTIEIINNTPNAQLLNTLRKKVKTKKKITNANLVSGNYTVTQADLDNHRVLLFDVVGSCNITFPNGLSDFDLGVYNGQTELTYLYGTNYTVHENGNNKQVSPGSAKQLEKLGNNIFTAGLLSS